VFGRAFGVMDLCPPQARATTNWRKDCQSAMRAHTSETQATITPPKALEFLKEGNIRFINNLRVNRNLLQQANETRDGQWPFATIVSCIDSRTSSELIFDQGLGDIFSVRIAGTVVNTDVIGSLEFACKLAGSKLIVVLGHTGCGAIKGACDHVEMGNLTGLLSKIQPAVYEERHTQDLAERTARNPTFVENVADLNVRRSVKTIVNRSLILEQLIENKELAVIGAKHDLGTGRVEFFDDTWIADRASLQAVVKVEGGAVVKGGARPARDRAPVRETPESHGAPVVQTIAG
jgi:carbonic anhydrase